MDSNKPNLNADNNNDGTFDLIEYGIAAAALFLIILGAISGLVGAYQDKKDFSAAGIGLIGTGTGILIKPRS